MRIRNVSHTTCSQEYFNEKKRTKQFVIRVQGQFKEIISCGDVWIGDMYDKPLNISSLVRVAIPIFKRLVPGIVLNKFSEKPRVMMLLGGEARTVSIDEPGSEPEMTGILVESNKSRIGKIFQSIKQRRKMLRNPKTASKYDYDPKYTYTFEFYCDIINVCDYSINLPFGNISLLKFLNYQPKTFAAVTNENDNRKLFSFKIFHEELVKSCSA